MKRREGKTGQVKGKHLVVSIIAFIASCSFLNNVYAAEEMKIAGSGSMIPLVTEIAKAYMAKNESVLIRVNQKSIESTGGIMSAAKGKINIGMSARQLKDEEETLGLLLVEIARVSTVIGVNKSVTVRNISSGQLCDVYQGLITNWRDLGGIDSRILAFTRPDLDATKEIIRRNIPCFEELEEPPQIALIQTSAQMFTALSKRTSSIGFTDSVAVARSEGEIIALSLDGISPTNENVRTGKYTITKSNFLVTKGIPAGDVKDFIDFIKSPEGRKVIKSMKAIPVN